MSEESGSGKSLAEMYEANVRASSEEDNASVTAEEVTNEGEPSSPSSEAPTETSESRTSVTAEAGTTESTAEDGETSVTAEAEPVEFSIPEDPEKAKRFRDWMHQEPSIQQTISDANAKGIRRGEANQATRQQGELQQAADAGDTNAQQQLASSKASQQERSQLVVQTVVALHEGCMDTIVDKFEVDRDKLVAAQDIPTLVTTTLETLDKRREAAFEKRVKAGVDARTKEFMDRQRPAIPAPDRGPNVGNSAAPAPLKDMSLAEAYAATQQQAANQAN